VADDGREGLSAGAPTSVRSYRPLRVRRGVAVFRLRGLRASAIRSARLQVGRRRTALSLRSVRRGAQRGRLELRLARRSAGRPATISSRSARAARLRVVLAKPAPSRPAPARPAAPVSRPPHPPVSAPTLSTGPAPSTSKPAPAPAPSAPSAGLATCGVVEKVLFTVDRWPGACWRPYSDSSPFNRAIPADAKQSANSQAIVNRVVGFGKPQDMDVGTAGTENDWGHPTYYSQPTDPVFTLHCTERWGTCPVEGHQIRIPDAARPAAGGDAHLTVVDQASGWEYDMWAVSSKPKGGGTLSFGWGGRTRIDGDGLGPEATAAGFGNLAGIIRGPEMQAGEINHALFMVISCDSGKYVYPAKKTGRPCSDIGKSNTDAPPMGTRFQLTMSPEQINALAVPAWKKTILRAMAKYGLYFGDTGSSSWAIQPESGQTYTSFGREDKMVEFARTANVPVYDGLHIFNVANGVDWARYLRVVDPCVSQGTC
jgi:hypothetical protein